MLKVKDHDDVDVCQIKMLIPYAGILKYRKHKFNLPTYNKWCTTMFHTWSQFYLASMFYMHKVSTSMTCILFADDTNLTISINVNTIENVILQNVLSVTLE